MPPAKKEPSLRPKAPFEPWDFESLSESHARNTEVNDRRLAARRKLEALAKDLAQRAKSGGLVVETRTSLHHPHRFNGMQVRRLWAYACRGKQEKTRLRKVLGRDLAKDLDAAYRNAYLCVALEFEALEVSLRIHPDGWYDGQNLINRVKAEGPNAWLELLNDLEGFRLRLHDWKGEFLCGQLTRDRLEEFLRYYVPGEHLLAVERRWPVPARAREVALTDEVPGTLLGELERLLPLYRYAVWSEESDFLFTS